VVENFGSIARFEATGSGVRMLWSNKDGGGRAEAALAVSAVGWSVDAAALNLAAAGVETDGRGFVATDADQRTSVPHIFAAGDVAGGAMLAPQAMQAGYIAASSAIGVEVPATARHLVPVGSFTDPEYARVGLTERDAGPSALVTKIPYAAATRPIIDGRTYGFCKILTERSSRRMLGCSIVGDRAVDIVQVAAIAMAAGMKVDALAHFPLSFPTYAGILSQAAARATYALNHGGE
jgi:pyruvate/2-oxoglutarate dehydrogenase complex dihydrolipoamide dehydrogenase (E3) component